MEAIRLHNVDVALISADLSEAPLSGFSALSQLQEVSPAVRSVLLLEKPEEHLIVHAFRCGAKGVCSRSDAKFENLKKCVECVHAGQVWANSQQLQYLLRAFSQQSTPLRIVDARGLGILSKREEEVVALVVEGSSNADIAKHLGLSGHTVKNHLFRIFDKLGVSNRLELALYAIVSTQRALLKEPIEAGADAPAAPQLSRTRLPSP